MCWYTCPRARAKHIFICMAYFGNCRRRSSWAIDVGRMYSDGVRFLPSAKFLRSLASFLRRGPSLVDSCKCWKPSWPRRGLVGDFPVEPVCVFRSSRPRLSIIGRIFATTPWVAGSPTGYPCPAAASSCARVGPDRFHRRRSPVLGIPASGTGQVHLLTHVVENLSLLPAIYHIEIKRSC